LNDSEALDFLIPGAHFLIKHEYVIFQIGVESLQLSDILFEFVATVVSAAELFLPDILLALVGAKITLAMVRVIVLSSQSMGKFEARSL